MILGIIGDDFTGSSDIANNLKKSGMQVSMFAGVPSFKNKASLTNADAAVIALKTRTISINEAVSESLKALQWLKNGFRVYNQPMRVEFVNHLKD